MMKTIEAEAKAIIDYVPTTSMEWGDLWEEQIGQGRFCEVLTGEMPSTIWKTALWCMSYMDSVAVKRALIDHYKSYSIICSDEVAGWVVLTMDGDVR